MSLRVDLGSGRQAMEVPDYVHIDKWAGDHIEYAWDLNFGLPKRTWDKGADGNYTKQDNYKVFEDNTVDEFRAHHFFEHLKSGNLIPLINELWDALKPTGFLHLYVPNAEHAKASWSDPDHVRPYTVDTWGYFTKQGWDAFPYTSKIWTIDDGFPRVNGSEGDWWEVEAIMRPVKSIPIGE